MVDELVFAVNDSEAVADISVLQQFEPYCYTRPSTHDQEAPDTTHIPAEWTRDLCHL
jgi:hypothetical protein